jgi:O-antigen/teichoic acid export membrane protein
MGIALLTMSVMQRIAKLGIDSALIQREEDNINDYLNTVWTIKAARGIVLSTSLFLAAPIFAAFFGEPRAEPILRVLSLGILVSDLINPAIVYFRKDLEFHKEFVLRLSGTITDFVVAIGAALILQNVWALVYAALSGRFVRLLVSYRMSDYRPSLEFNYGIASKVLGFGKWIWAAGIVTFIATSGDDAFVGWYLTAASLGLYQLAFRLSNSPATEVTHVITKVLFPTYSKLQNDGAALQTAFLKTIQVTFMIALPMGIGIVLIAPEFTRLVLGKQWMPMVPAMQVMAIGGLFRAISATGGALFQGYGVPEWDFWMNSVRAAAIGITIWPLTSLWGITGAAISITLGIGLTLPIWLYKTINITNLTVGHYGKSLGTPLLGAMIMSGPTLFVLGPSVWRLAGAVLAAMLIYSITIYYLYRFQSNDPIEDIISLITDSSS